jgi:hypothetical protein
MKKYLFLAIATLILGAQAQAKEVEFRCNVNNQSFEGVDDDMGTGSLRSVVRVKTETVDFSISHEKNSEIFMVDGTISGAVVNFGTQLFRPDHLKGGNVYLGRIFWYDTTIRCSLTK